MNLLSQVGERGYITGGRFLNLGMNFLSWGLGSIHKKTGFGQDRVEVVALSYIHWLRGQKRGSHLCYQSTYLYGCLSEQAARFIGA